MKIPTRDLVAIAKATLPIIPKYDRSKVICGAHLKCTGNELVFEATDRDRVASVTADCEPTEKFDVIVSRDTWQEISRIKVPRNDDSYVELEIVNDHGTLTHQSGEIKRLSMIDGKFPDITHAINAKYDGPPKSATLTAVDSRYMHEVFKAASILANEKAGGALMTINNQGNLRIEVPTNHGRYKLLSKPAIFIVAPMRLSNLGLRPRSE